MFAKGQPIPEWLRAGAIVVLPKLDRGTWKYGKRYTVFHVRENWRYHSGIEVQVQPLDFPGYKRPKSVDLGHVVRWVERKDDIEWLPPSRDT